MALAPDGRIITGGDDGAVRIWDLKDPSGQPTILRGHRDQLTALAFAPDGRLVTGSKDGTVRVWDLEHAADRPLIVQAQQGWIWSLAFSADGRLVTGGNDGTARVWHLDLDQLIKKAQQHAGRNLTYQEWQQFFGQEPYRRTFPDLPDGAGAEEARQAAAEVHAGTPSAPSPAVRSR
jgi:WD40 repeat protein